MCELGLNRARENEEELLRNLMQNLLGELSAESAGLEVKRDPSGTIFLLKPANSGAPVFGVHYDGCVDAFFGKRGTTFELPQESGLPKGADFDSVLQWAKDMGRAVIEGRCEERAGFLSVRETVLVRGKRYRVINFFHFRLFPKTFRYLPYESGVREAASQSSL
jgi:hypothetical protein